MCCIGQKWSLFIFGIMTMLLTSSCDKEQHYHPELSTGKELFDYHCASCHQKEGIGTFLKGVPANIATKKNLIEIVFHIKHREPGPASQMPVYRSMSDKEALKIARHLLKLKQDYFNKSENKEKLLLQRKK